MVPLTRRLALGAALPLLLALAPRLARAQDAAASPYVPLDDPAYVLLDALRARGLLGALPALERPYTVAAIRRALGADTASASAGARRLARALDAAVAKYDAGPAPAGELAARLSGQLGASVESSARRELMLADSTGGAYPAAAVRLVMRGGRVVAAARVIGDRRYKVDPEFTGKKNRAIAGRSEDGYVAAQWKLGELFVGRMSRLWGAPATGGLQLGSDAFSFDHVYGRFGNEHVALSSLVARLDDYRAADTVAQRYLALHRLSARWRGLEVAVSEGALYGGPGRGFELAIANPLNFAMLTQYDEGQTANMNFGLELSLRSRRGASLAGQLMVDDFQIDNCTPNCDEPASYGLTLSAEGLPLVGSARWFASYAMLSNLAYRTPLAWERWAYEGVGLGQGYSDFDEARLGAELVLGSAVVRPYVAQRRQGEGAIAVPYPAPAQYAATPGFLAGVVQTTRRVGVSGAWQFGGRAAVSGDVGYDWWSDAGHASGARRAALASRVRVSLEPGLLALTLTGH